MKSCRVSNGLDVVVGCQIIISSGNSWMLSHCQSWNGLFKRITQVGILRAASIASPPTGVYGQLHYVSEPSDLLRPRSLTAGQRAEIVQVHCIGAFRRQI